MSSARKIFDVDDLTTEELAEVLEFSALRNPPKVLSNKSVAVVFEKPSLRTRNSTEVAIRQLGGGVTTMVDQEIGIGVRESASDIASTLCGYHDLICARVKSHETLESFAAVSLARGVGVVNLLSDLSHPVQALADVLTIKQVWTGVGHPRLTYVGDSNNVASSLAKAASYAGIDVTISSPAGYEFDDSTLERLNVGDGLVKKVSNPKEGVKGADFIYTDVWVSMGQEDQTETRLADFGSYQVNSGLMALAGDGVKFMHCLPAHRDLEVSAEVIDSADSIVWIQAENRLHSMRGLLLKLFWKAN
ncbi:MAG: ornithine carbamoyltransferase [Acidimicrobiaceae bacterium]|nr:ornithine carbamoyltransferase [Acidimicrobiaceae bacterium]